jgi:hypothetical protein
MAAFLFSLIGDHLPIWFKYTIMANNKNKSTGNKQYGGVTDKKDKNAGSGAFNEGTEQDPNYNEATKVSDREKETGHLPFPRKGIKPADNREEGSNLDK